MSDLADALDAYSHAIACAAPSITRADLLADLVAAARDDINHAHQLETMLADPKGQQLVNGILERNGR